MNQQIVIPKKIDLKYASLWHSINNNEKIPAILKPVDYYSPLNMRDKQLYSAGTWSVLNEMANDSLIKQETIRKIHNKENGWIDQSLITVGRTPVFFWLGFGFIMGTLLTGGIQLIIAIMRHFL